MAAVTAPSVYRLLDTERLHPAIRDLDLKSSKALVGLINREDRRVAAAVGRQSTRIARAVDLLVSALRKGRRVVFVGAGSSGRLGVLESAECPPTFNTPPGLIRAVIAGGPRAVFEAREGVEDDEGQGARRLGRQARAGDAVVGIAASGVTPFVRGALRRARAMGCRTVLVTCNRRGVTAPADIVIDPQVGPEVIAGSTRLKSGTAAKLVLNTLTTAAMIRLGKVHDRWMVDLKPVSRKLRLRAIRIISELGGVGAARAELLLERCGREVKTAVLSARCDLSPAQARARLKAAGTLRKAMAR